MAEFSIKSISKKQWAVVLLLLSGLLFINFYNSNQENLKIEKQFFDEGVSSQAVISFVKLGGTTISYSFQVGAHTYQGWGNAEHVSIGSKIKIVYVDSNPSINRPGEKFSREKLNDESSYLFPVALLSTLFGLFMILAAVFMMNLIQNLARSLKRVA